MTPMKLYRRRPIQTSAQSTSNVEKSCGKRTDDCIAYRSLKQRKSGWRGINARDHSPSLASFDIHYQIHTCSLVIVFCLRESRLNSLCEVSNLLPKWGSGRTWWKYIISNKSCHFTPNTLHIIPRCFCRNSTNAKHLYTSTKHLCAKPHPLYYNNK